MQYPQQITKIKKELPVVELVKHYTNLSSKGNNLWGQCPFCHAHRTRSHIQRLGYRNFRFPNNNLARLRDEVQNFVKMINPEKLIRLRILIYFLMCPGSET